MRILSRSVYVLCFTVLMGTLSFSQVPAAIGANIPDDITSDPAQNKRWRQGEHAYSAKPKSMWELGLHTGYAFISGDVEAPFPAGYGFGLHARKSLNYMFSLRLDTWYTQNSGLDARFMSPSTLRVERLYNQNRSPALDRYINEGLPVHRNYRTSILGGSLQAVLNMGNLLFHQERNTWNAYALFGLGLNIPTINVNLLNGNVPYDFAPVTRGLNLDSKDGRSEARKRLRDLLDSSWETPGGVQTDIIAIGDRKKVLPHANLGVGVSRRLSERVNVSLEYQITLAGTDLYDGFEFRSQFDKTNNLDIPHYMSVRVGINLGDFGKRTPPLYWINPLSGALTDLAEVKRRPILDLTDTDGDGVIDMFDQDNSTPPGVPVDVRGVALDSDGDGIPDYLDAEPFSLPGYPVDEKGVAQVPDPGYVTGDEVNAIINQKLANIRTNWFLPMIHFDLDKYYVKPEFFGQLHHVATVLQQHPNVNVVVKGFADNRNSPEYNSVLSYNRAMATIDYLMSRYDIPRNRLIVQFGGHEVPLVPDLPATHSIDKQLEMQQYMNRRVEFLIATADDKDMTRPEGPEAGSGTPGSSRPGPKYSGNRNSGY